MRRVLIVEDDLATQFAMAKLFVCEGWTALQARTVAAALAQLEPPPDWIILDLGLADGNGEDVLHHLRATGVPSRVVILSGQLDDDRRAALQPLEPDAMIEKPIAFEDLLQACGDGP